MYDCICLKFWSDAITIPFEVRLFEVFSLLNELKKRRTETLAHAEETAAYQSNPISVC